MNKAKALLSIVGAVTLAYLILLAMWESFTDAMAVAVATATALGQPIAVSASQAFPLVLWFLPVVLGGIAAVIVLRKEDAPRI